MGAVWLTELDDWLAEEFTPDEFSTYPGWLTRSRSTGGYEAVWAIGTHHTASGAPSSNQMRYEWVTAVDGPIGAIHLAKDGHVTIGAAGATNTQGKGGPVATSKGVIPRDKGNLFMLSIEAANDGVGEPWPEVQVRNYVRLVAVLCRKLGLDPERDVFSHAGWCAPSTPGRKVDPAGPTPSEPVLGGVVSPPVRTWPDSEFRALTVAQLTPPPPPPSEEEPMSQEQFEAIMARLAHIEARLDPLETVAKANWPRTVNGITNVHQGELAYYIRRSAKAAGVPPFEPTNPEHHTEW